MQIEQFPFDEQECTIIVASWTYPDSMLEIHQVPTTAKLPVS
jgi:hypothetical protein